jgi:hypothetical protein
MGPWVADVLGKPAGLVIVADRLSFAILGVFAVFVK